MNKNTYKKPAPVATVEQEPIQQKPISLGKVKVTHPCLRRRVGPSTDSQVLSLITDFGVFNIFEEKDGWGKLEDGSWIMLSFTKKISK